MEQDVFIWARSHLANNHVSYSVLGLRVGLAFGLAHSWYVTSLIADVTLYSFEICECLPPHFDNKDVETAPLKVEAGHQHLRISVQSVTVPLLYVLGLAHQLLTALFAHLSLPAP